METTDTETTRTLADFTALPINTEPGTVTLIAIPERSKEAEKTLNALIEKWENHDIAVFFDTIEGDVESMLEEMQKAEPKPLVLVMYQMTHPPDLITQASDRFYRIQPSGACEVLARRDMDPRYYVPELPDAMRDKLLVLAGLTNLPEKLYAFVRQQVGGGEPQQPEEFKKLIVSACAAALAEHVRESEADDIIRFARTPAGAKWFSIQLSAETTVSTLVVRLLNEAKAGTAN